MTSTHETRDGHRRRFGKNAVAIRAPFLNMDRQFVSEVFLTDAVPLRPVRRSVGVNTEIGGVRRRMRGRTVAHRGSWIKSPTCAMVQGINRVGQTPFGQSNSGVPLCPQAY